MASFMSLSTAARAAVGSPSCCGFEFSIVTISLGRLPKANSRGVFPPNVSMVFLATHAFLMMCLGVSLAKSGSLATESAKMAKECLKSLTAVSALFGHGVAGPVGISFIPFVR